MTIYFCGYIMYNELKNISGDDKMLENVKQKKTKKSDVQQTIEALRCELSELENVIKERKLPVIITFDGWSCSGKGSQIAKLIKYLDPRFFRVVSFRAPSAAEKRKPWMTRYWEALPKKGELLFLDRSWYRDTVNAYMLGEIDKHQCKQRIADIKTFERQLTDDGCLIIKFFLHITKSEQEERLEKLADSSITSWRVEKSDSFNHDHYDKYLKHYDKMISETNTANAVWHIIPANDKTTAQLTVLDTVVNAIKCACAAAEKNAPYYEKSELPLADNIPQKFKTESTQKLAEIDMDKSIDDETYEKQLKKWQDKLFELQNICYQKKIPVIVAYEGWDAGGKGGNIKRLASALDPRGYEVHPIAAPEPSELARHYLWRFWTRLENDGHFTIFDRTWYGRVMVEPIEKITPQKRADMAYQEINEFEKQLSDWGAVIVKFWINIDKDEQYRRFKERENTPSKRWKITDEDWRNREKWDEYEKAVDRMIEKTSTEFAPWTVIEGNDKKYARIKALKTIAKSISKKLEEQAK